MGKKGGTSKEKQTPDSYDAVRELHQKEKEAVFHDYLWFFLLFKPGDLAFFERAMLIPNLGCMF